MAQDCWDGNRCSIDEHCGESGGICSSSLLWTNENNMNLTSQLQGQVQVKMVTVMGHFSDTWLIVSRPINYFSF